MYENHEFHIPVMGTGFSADLPLKIGRYGVNSVVSLVDDRLLEQLRAHYAPLKGVAYQGIGLREDDGRARRITAYFDFLQGQLELQIQAMKALPFTAGNDLCRYFELLPKQALRQRYHDMMALPDGDEKTAAQQALRERVLPGTIDANIMTKIDRRHDAKGILRASEDSDALSALRGYALSQARGSIVFSAGLNARLYGYIAHFPCFSPDRDGKFAKQVVLKVSDYRSAAIQGKFLAKRGVWVSEFRVEAGLNCGGHAFPADGQLVGVILDTFKEKRESLRQDLFAIWEKSLRAEGKLCPTTAPELRVTMQGGLGTATEQAFIKQRFGLDAGGWASPFLLVPELVALDESTRQRLQAATRKEIQLSWSSPLQVRYWNLISSASEDDRRQRLAKERPGSACPKGYLAAHFEYSKSAPLCLAARQYQKNHLVSLRTGTAQDACDDPTTTETTSADPLIEERAMAKSCICHELSGGILQGLGIDENASTSVCPGPNLANFSKRASLEDMLGHIYGRYNLLEDVERAHVFVTELKINIEFLHDEIHDFKRGISDRKAIYFKKAHKNLCAGIEFYRALAPEMGENGPQFLRELEVTAATLEALPFTP